jgi:hypothetical protein
LPLESIHCIVVGVVIFSVTQYLASQGQLQVLSLRQQYSPGHLEQKSSQLVHFRAPFSLSSLSFFILAHSSAVYARDTCAYLKQNNKVRSKMKNKINL